MTPDTIRKTLNLWNDAMQECDLRMSELAELTGQVVESPLGDAVYHVMGEYTKAVADLIEWDDGVLSDWCWWHNFGEKPMMIGFPGEDLQPVASIEDLADFIIEDLRRAESGGEA